MVSSHILSSIGLEGWLYFKHLKFHKMEAASQHAVDWGVKRLFKQTSKVKLNELAHYVINIFVIHDFAIVPCNTNGKKM